MSRKSVYMYVPSVTPKHVWKLYVIRGALGSIVAGAQEGRLTDGFFTFMMFQDRRESLTLPDKRLTDKVMERGLKEIREQLVTKGLAQERAE